MFSVIKRVAVIAASNVKCSIRVKIKANQINGYKKKTKKLKMLMSI